MRKGNKMIMTLTGEKDWWFYGEFTAKNGIQEWENEQVKSKNDNHVIRTLSNLAYKTKNGELENFYYPSRYEKFMKNYGDHLEIVDLRK